MRIAFLSAVLLVTVGRAQAADPIPPPKARAEAAAALALASSCDCPAGDLKCGKVAEVLAKVSREMEEATRQGKAAAKACGCVGGKCDRCPACECPPAAPPAPAVAPVNPVPPALPPVFRDSSGCEWTPHRAANGGVYWTRACPVRR